MIVTLPSFRDLLLNRAMDTIRAAFSRVIDRDSAADFLLLRSTGGTTWRITVDDAGVLHADPHSGYDGSYGGGFGG